MRDGNGSKTKKQLVKELPLRKEKVKGLEAERKQAEEVLRGAEQEKTTILHSLSELVVFQDLEHRVIWTNRIAGESVGQPSEKLAGRYCYDIWGKGGRPCPGCPVAKARKTGQPQSGEMITPDGKAWLVKGYPIRDASGDITGLVEMTLEITERKQAEEALQAEKNKLQSVIGAMEDGLTIQDKDYNIIYQNEITRGYFGDHVGEKCYRVYGDGKKTCEGCPVEKAFKDGKSHTGERRRVMPSGEVVFWENTASPVRDAKGKIISCLEITRDVTERKQAEEAMQESEAFQSGLLANSPIPISVVNADTSVRYVNPALEKLTGFSADELIGQKAPYPYWADESLPKTMRDYKKAMRQGSDRAVELFKRKNGERFWVEITSTPVRKDGKFHYFLTSWVDITERKQVENVLGQSIKWFPTLLEEAPIGICNTDLKGKITYVNRRFEKVSGYSRQEVVGKNGFKLGMFSAETLKLLAKRLSKRLMGGHPRVLEVQFKCKDGHWIWVAIEGKLIRAQGVPIGFQIISRDITERRQVEEALQDEKNKLQSVINAMEDGLTMQDRDFNIIYLNETLKKIYGGCVGQKCYRVYEGRDEVCDGCPVKKAFNDGKSHTAERKVVLPSGEMAFGENTASPVKDAQGKIVSCIEINRDITERKQAEEALQAEKNKLQSVIGAMEDGLTIQDRDYNIVYQNEPLKIIFGDRLGEKCYQAYEGREKVCDGCPMKKALKDGKSHTAERKVVLPSGEVTYWETTVNPVRDAKGKIVSCLEVARNITERKQAEDALRESEGRYRAVVEGTHDMIQSVGLDGFIIFVNKAWLATLGYTEAELSSLNLFDIIHPDSQAHCQKMFAKVASGKSLHGIEAAFLTKDGRKILVEGNAAPRYIGDKVVATQGVFRDITERKQAEEALADEATRHRILIDESSDGIVILDEKGKVYEANKRFAEMLGYTPEEVRNLNVWDWEAEFPREQVADMIASIGPEGDHFETQHRRKDGTVFDVEISTNGAVYAGQKLIFCVCRDITERRQAGKALAEAEEKYKNLVEAASDLIWEVDTQGRYTFVSPNIKDLLGYEVDEVVGKMRTLDLAPKKEVRKWLKRFKEVNAKRAGFSGFEVLHLHKNGTPVIFEVSGIPFVDSAGNFKGYVGINKDVTERNQVAEALKESQEFSNGLLENSPNPIFVLNPDTSVKYVNPAFEKLTGFSLAEIAGKKAPYPWWLKEESKAMTLSLKKAMVSGGKRSEKVFHKKNGERFWVALNSAPLMHRGKLLYFLINWLDITERKRAEEEKLELEQKAHLASRLASVGEMASGIAHEINNPLTAVIGFAQLLMDADLPDDSKEDLVIIHKEAQRAAGVARNLLTFARKHAPSKQSTNVNSIIEGVLTLRAYEQNVSNIQVNTKLAPDLPEVKADYSQLQQVFINLILNAEAAMLSTGNGGTLTITTQKVNHSIRASFADDGPGITKENLDRIFDPFFTTKEVGKGTGLGLSVCHGIIAEHGGKIYARSKPGSGATFVVELPVNAHEQLEEPNETA